MIVKYIPILLFFSISLQANMVLSAVRNPFIKPITISCEILEQQLISNLNIWRYQGYFLGDSDTKKAVLTIWITNQKEWLRIDDFSPPQFMPWQITDISIKQVIWQTSLPDYCYKNLVINMPFTGN